MCRIGRRLCRSWGHGNGMARIQRNLIVSWHATIDGQVTLVIVLGHETST